MVSISMEFNVYWRCMRFPLKVVFSTYGALTFRLKSLVFSLVPKSRIVSCIMTRCHSGYDEVAQISHKEVKLAPWLENRFEMLLQKLTPANQLQNQHPNPPPNLHELMEEEEEEENNCGFKTPSDEDKVLVSKSLVPPTNYIFKIESFSLLSKILQKREVDKYESSEFEAGGYKWRLLLYPNGHTKSNYVTLYLAISETNNLPLGWEVNVIFKFYVFNQISGEYLTFQGSARQYNALNTEWGTSLLCIYSFNDPSMGYLIDDCCVFGVDVFVSKCEGKRKAWSLSIIKEPNNGTFTWKLDKFSGMNQKSYLSTGFTVGGHQWKLLLYPRGDSSVKGKSLSLFLSLSDSSTLRPGLKLYMEYKLRIKNQVHYYHIWKKGDACFHASDTCWGFASLQSLSDLNDARNGFIVNDTMIVEVKITNFYSVLEN